MYNINGTFHTYKIVEHASVAAAGAKVGETIGGVIGAGNKFFSSSANKISDATGYLGNAASNISERIKGGKTPDNLTDNVTTLGGKKPANDLNKPDNPTQPKPDNPTQPNADNPTQPNADNPTQPKADNPTQPKADNPTQPKADNPTQPKADNPTQPKTPDNLDPTKPKTQDDAEKLLKENADTVKEIKSTGALTWMKENPGKVLAFATVLGVAIYALEKILRNTDNLSKYNFNIIKITNNSTNDGNIITYKEPSSSENIAPILKEDKLILSNTDCSPNIDGNKDIITINSTTELIVKPFTSLTTPGTKGDMKVIPDIAAHLAKGMTDPANYFPPGANPFTFMTEFYDSIKKWFQGNWLIIIIVLGILGIIIVYKIYKAIKG